jgi:hypothetical protein
LPLIAAAKGIRDELMSPAIAGSKDPASSPLDDARGIATGMKKTTLAAIGLALETHGQGLEQQQEVVMHLADLVLESFAAESALLRAAAAADSRLPAASLHADAAATVAHDSGLRAEAIARTVLAGLQKGDALRTSLAGVRRLLKVAPIDTMAARRRLADAIQAARGYPFA